METSKVGIDVYLSTLHQTQREIITTALQCRTPILPIPIGLGSYLIALSISACLVKADAHSANGPGKHVLLFEPVGANRIKNVLARIPFRWQFLSSGPLQDGLNLIAASKIERFRNTGPIRSIVFSNNTLLLLGSKRLPILKQMLDSAERRHLIANGGIVSELIPKLQALFGVEFARCVNGSVDEWIMRLRAVFGEQINT